MAGTVGVDALRADNMDNNTNCTNIGGGAGTAQETDNYYQGTAAVSRKVTAAGFFTSTGANRDVTAAGRKTWMAKVGLTNFAGATSLELRVGSGTNAYHVYTVFSGAGNYPSAQGGFVFVPIDANIAGYRSSTSGNPSLTAASYFGTYMTGPTSKAENLAMDSVDLVYGLFVSGGTAPSPATFDDFQAYDEGAIGNRYGLFREPVDKTYLAFGQLVIGATTASGVLTTTACIFNASDRSVLFPDGLFDAGWSGITIDIGNASTDVDWSAIKIIGLGNTTTTDTRPTIDVIGTSGAFDADACTLDGCASIDLTSVCSLTNSQVINSGLLTANDANLSGTTVSGSTAASAVLWNVATDPNTDMTGMAFTSGGTGHAIEFGTTSPLTMSLTDVDFSGYAGSNGSTGNEAVWVRRTGGTVTINVSGGNEPTIRTDGATVNVITGQRALTIKGVPSGAEWRLYEDSLTAGVIGTVALDGAESHSGGDITYNYSYSSDQDVALQVIADGFEEFTSYFTLQDANQTQNVTLEAETNT